jgi:hypothetical protein
MPLVALVWADEFNEPCQHEPDQFVILDGVVGWRVLCGLGHSNRNLFLHLSLTHVPQLSVDVVETPLYGGSAPSFVYFFDRMISPYSWCIIMLRMSLAVGRNGCGWLSAMAIFRTMVRTTSSPTSLWMGNVWCCHPRKMCLLGWSMVMILSFEGGFLAFWVGGLGATGEEFDRALPTFVGGGLWVGMVWTFRWDDMGFKGVAWLGVPGVQLFSLPLSWSSSSCCYSVSRTS